MITVLNKIDLLEDRSWLEQLKGHFINPVAVSAKLKENLGLLLEKIEDSFSGRMIDTEIFLKHGRMDLVDLFYREGKVKEIQYLQKAIKIKLSLPKIIFHKLLNNKDIEEVN
ncbi:MAG: hypothetical protein WC321_03540 [Candidatus Omnitrophota bacterium]|jgi:50S ribosomal subunit-associated GTPase HflX